MFSVRYTGLGTEKRKYIKWLLGQSMAPKTKIESVITEDAVAMLGEKLSTPLQFEFYQTRTLEEAEKVQSGYSQTIEGETELEKTKEPRDTPIGA
jgi:type II secretory pathway predicted ATPase ExeA